MRGRVDTEGAARWDWEATGPRHCSPRRGLRIDVRYLTVPEPSLTATTEPRSSCTNKRRSVCSGGRFSPRLRIQARCSSSPAPGSLGLGPGIIRHAARKAMLRTHNGEPEHAIEVQQTLAPPTAHEHELPQSKGNRECRQHHNSTPTDDDASSPGNPCYRCN